jgi:hypothetical protein
VLPRVLSIDGPVISTAELSRQQLLLEQVLGLERRLDATLEPGEVEALFGPRVRGLSARLIRYVTPGTGIGVELVRFEPASDTVIRVGGVGIACDALKMLDFFVSDPDGAKARLRDHGFELVTEGATLELPDGTRFVETHVRAPDGVMVAAITPLNAQPSAYVSVTDRLFSEVQSSSGPVSEFESVRVFYEDVLGVSMGLRYEFESASFSQMIGAGRTTTIRAHNYGRVVEDVMLGIIHYGLPPGSYESLRDRAQPPHRGLIGVRLSVQGLDELVERCGDAGYEIPVAPAPLPSLLRCVDGPGRMRTSRAAVVRGPHGVWHFLREVDATPRAA